MDSGDTNRYWHTGKDDNVAWKENVVAHGQGVGVDELMTYDSVGQLTGDTWGQLNDAHNALTSNVQYFGEQWSIDPLGNWTDYQQNDGSGNSYGDQFRTSDPDNQITSLSGGAVTPYYDLAGNITYGPQPLLGSYATQSVGQTYVYDAWNRLVSVSGGGSAVYEYDGLGRRVAATNDTCNVGTGYYFYAGQNVVEVYGPWLLSNGSSLAPGGPWTGIEYVYSAHGGNVPILRDGWGPSYYDGRLYYLTDANNNVTTLLSSSGSVLERYAYNAYGFAGTTFRRPEQLQLSVPPMGLGLRQHDPLRLHGPGHIHRPVPHRNPLVRSDAGRVHHPRPRPGRPQLLSLLRQQPHQPDGPHGTVHNVQRVAMRPMDYVSVPVRLSVGSTVLGGAKLHVFGLPNNNVQQ